MSFFVSKHRILCYTINIVGGIMNNNFSTELRKKIYFLVRKMLSTTRNFEFKFLNEEKLETDGTVIYSVNHSNCHDLPTIAEISNEHFFLLAGVQNLRLIDKLAFFLLGCIYVDRKNKENTCASFLGCGNNPCSPCHPFRVEMAGVFFGRGVQRLHTLLRALGLAGAFGTAGFAGFYCADPR